MSSKRAPDFDLAAAVRQAGFTPRAGDVPAIFDLLGGSEDDARAAERVLARLGESAATGARARLAAAEGAARARLVRLVGRLALERPELAIVLVPELIARATDRDARAGRQAINALGKLPASPVVEHALLDRLESDETPPEHTREIVEALGKCGGPRSLERLRILRRAASHDAELGRLTDQAVLRLGRTLRREADSAIDGAAKLSAQPIEVHCRAGLEELLIEELGPAWHPRARGPGIVTATMNGTLESMFRARTMLRFGFVVRMQPGQAAAAIVSPAALAILRAVTHGPIRYRLSFASGGHRRAEVLRVATEVGSAEPDLENDPTETTWEIEVRERSLLLVPKKLDDPRFTYRLGDVPAASHPTLAAAIARVAGARADDVVWDPFTGSGTELIERARLGPLAELHGSDLDPAAIAIAAKNCAAAGVNASLQVRDALAGAPAGVTAILTNPPMGRRVLDRSSAGRLLEDFVAHAARALPAGGRLVWISPFGDRTAEVAARAGLRATYRQVVDMGGFSAELQRLEKTNEKIRPSLPRRPPPLPSTSRSPRSRG